MKKVAFIEHIPWVTYCSWCLTGINLPNLTVTFKVSTTACPFVRWRNGGTGTWSTLIAPSLSLSMQPGRSQSLPSTRTSHRPAAKHRQPLAFRAEDSLLPWSSLPPVFQEGRASAAILKTTEDKCGYNKDDRGQLLVRMRIKGSPQTLLVGM